MARDDDDGERLLCRKNAGKRGQVYEEWEKEFLDACGAKGDEDASWEDTLLGNECAELGNLMPDDYMIFCLAAGRLHRVRTRSYGTVVCP